MATFNTDLDKKIAAAWAGLMVGDALGAPAELLFVIFILNINLV